MVLTLRIHPEHSAFTMSGIVQRRSAQSDDLEYQALLHPGRAGCAYCFDALNVSLQVFEISLCSGGRFFKYLAIDSRSFWCILARSSPSLGRRQSVNKF